MTLDWIDQAYINRVSLRLERFKERGRLRFNFRCPICGDSAKDPSKTRGWLFDKDGQTKFHCFNDETCGSKFSYFLYRIDRSMFNEYQMDRFKEYGGGDRKPSKGLLDDIDQEEPKAFGDPSHVHDLPTIASLPSTHFAKQYIADRQLPVHLWEKLYFTDAWKNLTNQFEQTYDKIYKDEPRIVIPAYNRTGQLSSFQGRSLDPNEDQRKYMTVKVLDELKIWGIDKIKTTKPVFLLEGAFDAMLLDNTAAMFGGLLNPEDLPTEFDWVFVLDNEPRNISVLRRYQQLIHKGAKFVSWKNWKLPYKDVNLCVQNGVNAKEIQRYFENNTVQGLMAQLEFDKWRKAPI